MPVKTEREPIFWIGDTVKVKNTNWAKYMELSGRCGKVTKGIKAKYWVQVEFSNGSFVDINTAHLEHISKSQKKAEKCQT